ncbi:MAG: c-type cytochrome, partial [Bacteroidota bacterium]|nr:c-type cytochrome [Bacteroidota bacterium]
PLPEHSGNGLWRGVDNWYYNAKSRFRYRFTKGQWQRDSTEFRGQWGICHDDEGRLIYNYNWSQLHADLVPPNYLSRNRNHLATTGIDHGLTVDRRVYPIRPNPAVNRGYIPGTLDKQGRLLEFTAACSPFFYRSNLLPKEYYGNAFVCEPSGNLIKRNIVEQNGFLMSARDAHPGKEFLASTDERFRPVHLSSGPDGALYVTDMYRGLVQHAAYITPFLRDITIQRNLVQPVHYGRIWRIVPQNWKPVKSKKLSNASSKDLVELLKSPNGWTRDVAQRLLVERKYDKNVADALSKLASTGRNNLGRFHALWTLEGLHANEPKILLKLLSDHNSQVATTAMRLLEPFAKKYEIVRIKLEQELLHKWHHVPAKQVLQMALSAQVLNHTISKQLLAGITGNYASFPVIRDAVLSSLGDHEMEFLELLWKSSQWQKREANKEIFLEMLSAAIMRKKNAQELTTLLVMLNAKQNSSNWRQNAVIAGLTTGGDKSNPVQLKSRPAIFAKYTQQGEAPQLAKLSALFDWPGNSSNKGTSVTKSLLNNEQQRLFSLGRQHFLTTCAGCHGTNGAGLKRFAPPLIGSDWVVGDERRLALIVLHGLEGRIKVAGKVYDAPDILPVMPAHSTMDDAAITAILTYIRNEWGNDAGPVDKRTVGTTRNTSQGRVMPWKPDELKKYVTDTKSAASN